MPTALHEVEEAVLSGAPDARTRLERLLASVPDNARERLAWGSLCEAAGEPTLAREQYEAALREAPDDPDLLDRLRVLHEERGHVTQALDLARQRWRVRPDAGACEALCQLLVAGGHRDEARRVAGEAVARGLAVPPVDETRGGERAGGDLFDVPFEEPGSSRAEAGSADADAVRFLARFAGRENVYARQWASEAGDVGYSPVKEPLTVRQVRQHLNGSVTLGVYVVRLDDTVGFFAIDVDVTKRAIEQSRGRPGEARRLRGLAHAEALRLRDVLAGLGLPALLEDSGYKGRHVWVLLAEPVPAAEAREFGARLLAAHPPASTEIAFEFFPKQGTAGRGIGNLIKLPLGLHRKSGRRSVLLRDDGTEDPQPHATLRQAPRPDAEAFLAALSRVRELPAGVAAPAPAGEPGESAQVAAPAAPLPPPAWTAADFETNPEVAHLLGHCTVLGALRERAERHRRLSHDERLVLANALGHSGAGVLAVNYLFGLCPDTPPEARLQSPLAGNPISCAKVRYRVPHVAGAVRCRCAFPERGGCYPTPRRHLETLDRAEAPAAAAGAWDPAERARALGVLWRRRAEVERELAQLETQLAEWLEQHPGGGIDTGDGVLRLVTDGGPMPQLKWEPRTPAAGVAATVAATVTADAVGEGD